MSKHQCLNMVVGYPLEHSLSPVLHNTVYAALDINAVLLAFPQKKIKPLIQAIKTLSVGLTAVTMPFKQKVLRYLDDCSPEVKKLTAANTLIQRDGKLYGYNTDVDGIAYALATTHVANKNVLIIGAGGAACAVGYFMQKNHAQLFWLNRTTKKAWLLAKKFSGTVLREDQLNATPIDIIVHATSLGMYPENNRSPLPDYAFNSAQAVFDLVYNPMQTQLLDRAQKSGATIISGSEMFIGQGIKQIELWTGRDIAEKKITEIIRKKIMG